MDRALEGQWAMDGKAEWKADMKIWSFIPQISGCRKPENASEISILQDEHEISGIVSLLDNDENLDLYKSTGIPYIHTPVKGGTAPTQKQIDDIIKFQETTGSIVIHCTNGRRRTGTVLGALYIHLAMRIRDDKALFGDSLFEDMKQRLIASKHDCDLRDEQWQYLKDLCQG